MKLNWQQRDTERVKYFIRRGMFQDLDEFANDETPDKIKEDSLHSIRVLVADLTNRLNRHIYASRKKREDVYE